MDTPGLSNESTLFHQQLGYLFLVLIPPYVKYPARFGTYLGTYKQHATVVTNVVSIGRYFISEPALLMGGRWEATFSTSFIGVDLGDCVYHPPCSEGMNRSSKWKFK